MSARKNKNQTVSPPPEPATPQPPPPPPSRPEPTAAEIKARVEAQAGALRDGLTAARLVPIIGTNITDERSRQPMYRTSCSMRRIRMTRWSG